MNEMEKLYEAGLRKLEANYGPFSRQPTMRAQCSPRAFFFVDPINAETTDADIVESALAWVDQEFCCEDRNISLTALSFLAGARMACLRLEVGPELSPGDAYYIAMRTLSTQIG